MAMDQLEGRFVGFARFCLKIGMTPGLPNVYHHTDVYFECLDMPRIPVKVPCSLNIFVVVLSMLPKVIIYCDVFIHLMEKLI